MDLKLLLLLFLASLFIGVHALLWDALRGRKNASWEAMNRAARSLPGAVKSQSAEMDELARRVAELRSAGLAAEKDDPGAELKQDGQDR